MAFVPADEDFEGVGKGIEVALPGDTIRKRHICTRASNKRQIVVLVLGDAEFEGYSIGLDSHSLQLLEFPSGDVSSIALEHIVAITDGKAFATLTPDEKDLVDRRTASFRKTSQTWLVKNWPEVYDKRDDAAEGSRPRTPYRPPLTSRYGQGSSDAERRNYGDPQVRD